MSKNLGYSFPAAFFMNTFLPHPNDCLPVAAVGMGEGRRESPSRKRKYAFPGFFIRVYSKNPDRFFSLSN